MPENDPNKPSTIMESAFDREKVPIAAAPTNIFAKIKSKPWLSMPLSLLIMFHEPAFINSITFFKSKLLILILRSGVRRFRKILLVMYAYNDMINAWIP